MVVDPAGQATLDARWTSIRIGSEALSRREWAASQPAVRRLRRPIVEAPPSSGDIPGSAAVRYSAPVTLLLELPHSFKSTVAVANLTGRWRTSRRSTGSCGTPARAEEDDKVG